MNTILKPIIDYVCTPVRVQLNQAEDEIQEEIQLHLESRMEEYQREGMSLEESNAATLHRFGNIGRVVKECCRETGAWQMLIHRFHLLLTTVLVLSTSLLAFQMLQQSPAQVSVQSGVSAQPNSTLSRYDGDVGGLVIDELGKPVANAQVMVAVKWWPRNGFRQQCYMTTTDSEGAFALTGVYPAEMRHEVQIASIADGRLLTSTYISDQTQAVDSVAIQLAPATAEFSLEFKSESGEPMPGVSAFPHRRIDTSGEDHLVYFQSAEKIIRESDTSGRVQFSNFKPGDQATLYVKFPDDDWQERKIVVPEHEESVVVISQINSATAGG